MQYQDQNFCSRALAAIAPDRDRESRIQRGSVTEIITRVHEKVFEVKIYLRVNLGQGAQLKVTRETLTIRKRLSLWEIVDLIEYLDDRDDTDFGDYDEPDDDGNAPVDDESTVDELGKKLSKTKIR